MSMQGPIPPTEDDEASVPTEHVPSSPQHGPTPPALSAGNRKAAKRTFPFDLEADEIQLALPRPQDVDMRERKRPRLEEPFPTSTDEATAENTAHDITEELPPPPPPPAGAGAGATDHADSDHVVDMHPSARTTWAPRRWTPEEDAKLTSAVTNTCKKKHGKEYNMDWIAISAQVPGRTRSKCKKRWSYALDPNIDHASERTGKWTADEVMKLTSAVTNTHKKKHDKEYTRDWVAVSAQVPGRTRDQCRSKWLDALESKTYSTARTGHWTADENKKLKDAVPAHGCKNWEEIALLVPGRTKSQCHKRWDKNVKASIVDPTARTGHWKADENKKLMDAVPAHAGAKNWEEIALLVPGRTKKQCRKRWEYNLRVSSLDPTTARMGKLTADEDTK